MATKTGLDAQVGYVKESTYGTGVTVTRFLPLISETMKKDIEWVESPGIYAGAQVLRSVQMSQGNAKVGGDIQHELMSESIGMLFEAAFGTVAESGTVAPYTHTFTPAAPGVSLTCQVGVPTAVSGSVIPKTYTGCKVASWELAAEAGKNVTWGMTLVAQEETMSGTSIATASYTTTMFPYSFKTATLTVDGTSVPVKSVKFSGDNGLDDGRFTLGGTTIQEPLRQSLAAYTGEFVAEWGNPSSMGTLNYHRFLGGTQSTLVLTFAVSSLSKYGTITANVRYDGSTPQVSGPGIVEHTIPFKCIASGTLDSQAITAVLKNADATA